MIWRFESALAHAAVFCRALVRANTWASVNEIQAKQKTPNQAGSRGPVGRHRGGKSNATGGAGASRSRR